ncbi:MAG: hypothetical protein IPH84_19800, partial [Bacteroidales bacterium]|nr:hypothetical protein [Bacteroidales bacterium]
PAFYSKKDSLTIQLTSFTTNWDSSFIRIYKNKKQLQKIFEPMSLSPNNLYEPARIADINGDNLLDVKLISSYNGCGLAAMNVRVIFLFQNSNGTFTKISFDDKMDENGRVERDFNGDSNFEIITMDLKSYKSHNYWLFNIYNFKNYKLVNVNPSYDYPIMIQYLLRDNYEITNKISRVKMKEFGKKLPDNYDRK